MLKESNLWRNNNVMTSTLLFRLYYRKQCTVQYYFRCNLLLLLILRDNFVGLIIFTYLENLAQSDNGSSSAIRKNLAQRLYCF